MKWIDVKEIPNGRWKPGHIELENRTDKTVRIVTHGPNGGQKWIGDYPRAELIQAIWPEGVAALKDARLQIDYLHGKFQETGSGNAVLSRIGAALAMLEVK